MVPAAVAGADLLERSFAPWSHRVEARTSMHDLLFTPPHATYPFDEWVRVTWDDDVFEFGLWSKRGVLTVADKCRSENAAAVLDSLLVQLVGDSS